MFEVGVLERHEISARSSISVAKIARGEFQSCTFQSYVSISALVAARHFPSGTQSAARLCVEQQTKHMSALRRRSARIEAQMRVLSCFEHLINRKNACFRSTHSDEPISAARMPHPPEPARPSASFELQKPVTQDTQTQFQDTGELLRPIKVLLHVRMSLVGC